MKKFTPEITGIDDSLGPGIVSIMGGDWSGLGLSSKPEPALGFVL
jgi:hypothetical protein